MTTEFILSQVFIILNYCFYAVTFLVKKRNLILTFGFLGLTSTAISNCFLSAWTGVAMAAFSMARQLTFLIQNKLRKDKNNINKITKVDYITISVLFVLSIVLAYFTYQGPLSLLSVVGALLSTFAVWQKNTMVYKVMSVFASICFVAYYAFIGSTFGYILESILILFEIAGIIKESRKNKSTKNENNENKIETEAAEETVETK